MSSFTSSEPLDLEPASNGLPYHEAEISMMRPTYPFAGSANLRNQIKRMDKDSLVAFNERSPDDPVYINNEGKILNPQHERRGHLLYV